MMFELQGRVRRIGACVDPAGTDDGQVEQWVVYLERSASGVVAC